MIHDDADGSQTRKMAPIDSSDYEDDDAEYEEVGFEEYENDEDNEVIIPPVSSGENQGRRSSILAQPLNELEENLEGEEDDDYEED